MAANRERVALASCITGSVLAGGNAVGVRFSNRELAPLWGAGLRFLVAAALLVAVMAALRQPPPPGTVSNRCRSDGGWDVDIMVEA